MTHHIAITDTIHLELTDVQHAQPLLDTLNSSRIYLRKWLPWVDHMQTTEDFNQYVMRCKAQHTDGTDYGYVIVVDNIIAGRIGIHYINYQNKLGAIGYWIAENFQGKGIITRACKVLINEVFTRLDLNRIEIKCGVCNTRSQAIPEKLGFTHEGILRQAEWLYDHFIDLHLYSLLKEEWSEKPDV